MKERGILMSAPEVEWRAAVGFEGRYEVSSEGHIRTLTTYRPHQSRIVLKPRRHEKGYLYVSLRDTGGTSRQLAVHRVVLDAFVGPRPAGKQAAHWNGDPSDNRIANLRWASSAENHADRKRHGRVPSGERNAASRLDTAAAKTIKKLRGLVSAYEVAHLACVDRSTVERIWAGEAWRDA